MRPSPLEFCPPHGLHCSFSVAASEISFSPNEYREDHELIPRDHPSFGKHLWVIKRWFSFRKSTLTFLSYP